MLFACNRHPFASTAITVTTGGHNNNDFFFLKHRFLNCIHPPRPPTDFTIPPFLWCTGQSPRSITSPPRAPLQRDRSRGPPQGQLLTHSPARYKSRGQRRAEHRFPRHPKLQLKALVSDAKLWFLTFPKRSQSSCPQR